MVGSPGLIGPGIRRTRVGIADRAVAAAGQRRRVYGYFVAVIHHGRADVGELEQRRQFQALLGLRQAGVAGLGHHVQRAIHVVRIEQVQHGRGRLRRIVVAYGADGVDRTGWA